jgi:hypothetical protein
MLTASARCWRPPDRNKEAPAVLGDTAGANKTNIKRSQSDYYHQCYGKVHTLVTKNRIAIGAIQSSDDGLLDAVAWPQGNSIGRFYNAASASKALIDDRRERQKTVATTPDPKPVFKLTPTHGRMFRRRSELARLVTHRQRYGVAIYDRQAWALVMADLLLWSRHGADYESFTDFANMLGIEFDERTSMAAIYQINAISKRKGAAYRPFNGTAVATMLGVTLEEKLLLKIRTINAIDETRAECEARRKEEKREYWRHWKRIDRAKKRAEKGLPPVSEKPVSISQAKPWEALAMSRATWYRKGKPSHEMTGSSHNTSSQTVGPVDPLVSSHSAEGRSEIGTEPPALASNGGPSEPKASQPKACEAVRDEPQPQSHPSEGVSPSPRARPVLVAGRDVLQFNIHRTTRERLYAHAQNESPEPGPMPGKTRRCESRGDMAR